MDFTFRIWLLNLFVVVVEENFSSCRDYNHGARRWSFHTHYQLHLFFLVFTWEQRIAHVELVQDAAEGPHVDGRVVGDAHDDLGGTVEPRLDIGVDLFVDEGGTSEVNDLYARLVGLLEQDVLGLQIAVDDLEHFQVLKGV